MKDDLFQAFRSHQNYFIWIWFSLFDTKIYKKMFTYMQDSKAEKLCCYYLDLITKSIRQHRIRAQELRLLVF